jgi:hypothetical protein
MVQRVMMVQMVGMVEMKKRFTVHGARCKVRKDSA